MRRQLDRRPERFVQLFVKFTLFEIGRLGTKFEWLIPDAIDAVFRDPSSEF
jgi:hypothetical protein